MCEGGTGRGDSPYALAQGMAGAGGPRGGISEAPRLTLDHRAVCEKKITG